MLDEPLAWEDPTTSSPTQDAQAMEQVMALQGWASQFSR
jgi:hypothetical protein